VSRDQPTADPLAELADLILNVGRLIRAITPPEADAYPLTDTERTVMRLIDLQPGSAPSEIARRGRLQRSNVSAALRGLEQKGLIRRTATDGRGVAVTATPAAAANLHSLRAAWSQELAGVLGDDLDAVRHCTRVLSRLERSLVDPL
jgi:DNA-binding MarR family transcriptional regulator